ncbi:MAG: diphthamide biosynthesis enzyme Dph2 [Candidatus Diapherotrites archaeon]
MLEINLKDVVSEIKKHKAKIIAIQIPEGLKTKALEISSEIEKKAKVQTIIFTDPCFGACDLADVKSKIVGADLLVHFGHTKFYNPKIDTIFVPLKVKLKKKDLEKVISKLADALLNENAKKVALCGTIQYAEYFDFLKKELKKSNIEVFIGKGNITEHGQVLGCNYSAVKNVENKADTIVYFGDGMFHPLGVWFAVDKNVIIVDPIENKVKILENERDSFLRKRFAQIEIAKKAKTFGILVTTKTGQMKSKKAFELKKLIESKGKKSFILVSDLIKPEYLLGMKIDALVNTACPRIGVDDFSYFKIPILNPKELEITLGKRKWENYELE